MVFNGVIEKTGMIIDAAGVVVIVAGAAIACAAGGVRLSRRESAVYLRFRQQLGQAILLPQGAEDRGLSPVQTEFVQELVHAPVL